ncbi:MAG TPA: NADH-quinone oxidoreductase subunit D [Thermoanaerobaculia bacterium]|nr:NADH-quinone oxidoreductase subunit D [Thermoanaerobaculia bacterium]
MSADPRPIAPPPAEDDAGTLLGLHEMEINFGPQHPSTHGVLRLVLKVDGEKIVSVRPDIGYLHRGTEKLFETETYPMVVPHTDRMDYVAAATNNHAYCLAVEKLLGVATPPRAQRIRVVLDELQRISSHLLWLGTSAIDLGAMTPFFYCFREREAILDAFEEYCGARLTLNCMKIGGLPLDVTPRFMQMAHDFVGTFEKRVDEYEDLLTENRIWKKRTVGIGVFPVEKCVEWGVTGPPLRGAGLAWDLRRAIPYECYPELKFEIPIGKNADTYDRYLVRMAEMRQSRLILEQCLAWLDANPGGEIKGKVPRVIKPAAGECYAAVESPKGELGFYIVATGGNKPYRLRVRPPSFVNLQALPEMVKGHLVSDLVAVIGTIDIVLGEVDR